MMAAPEDKCDFGLVQEVTIEAVSAVAVTFSTRGDGSGTPDDRLRKSFVVPRSEVHDGPFADAPSPVALVPGAIGALFLSRVGWQTRSVDGYSIYGLTQVVYKFPVCAAPTQLRSQLAVVPHGITVRGQIEGKGALVDIDLFGPDAAEAQAFRWGGSGDITVQLSEHGARRLGVAQSVKLWPTRIAVKGSPAFDPAVKGEVDLLDDEVATGTQEISYSRRGAPVLLWLTADGVNAFHVTPQLAAEFSTAS